MRTQYTIPTPGLTFDRKSNRDDFRFAVIYLCSLSGWKLAGLRANKDAAEKLRESYSKNEKTETLEIEGVPCK